MKYTSILSVLLHGFFLVSLNLFSIMTAIVIIQISSISNEKIIQSSIALLINVGVYFLVYKLMHGIQKELMEIEKISMLVTILLISFALLPMLFYPVDFLMSGSWSSIHKLMTTWPYQMIANGLCLISNYFIFSKTKK